MQSQPASEVGGFFGRAWELLTANWIIIVPGLVIGIAAGILSGIFWHPATVTYDANGVPQVSGAMASAAGGVITSIIQMVALVLTITYTTGMAGAAWATGKTTLADGGTAFRRDAGAVVVALIGLWIVGLIAAFLTFFTLGISMLAYLFFFLYTMPAAVVGERSGIEAMQESCSIATKRFGTTLITVLLIAVIFIVVGLLTGWLHFAPLIGPVIQMAIGNAVVAYASLVIVGEYLRFHRELGTAGGPASVPPTIPPPGSPLV